MSVAKTEMKFPNAQEQPGLISLENGRQAFIKIDAIAHQGDLCILGGWLSEPLQIFILADRYSLEALQYESFRRPDVNAYLSTSCNIEHGFGLVFEYNRDVPYQISVAGTIFELNIAEEPYLVEAQEANIFGENNVLYFINKQKEQGEKNKLTNILGLVLDTDYLKLNADLRLCKVEARSHFHDFGRHEHRQFSFIIDEYYVKSLAEYKEAATEESGIEFFFHNGAIPPNSWLNIEYINYKNKNKYQNWTEAIHDIYTNRIGSVTPFFDEQYYLENARKRGIEVLGNPLLHYLSDGWREGLDFHPFFDSWYFIEKNDIRRIEKPYLLYLFDGNLYEISPYLNIAYLNNVINDIIKSNYKKLYELLFSGALSAANFNPDYREEISKYILNGSIGESVDGMNGECLMRLLKICHSCARFANDNPKLSIIIVNFHKPALTLLAIFSALFASENLDAEIIIVENESDRFETEILYRYLKNIKNIRIITLKENAYFGEANNIAIEQSNGELVLLLNNDAFISRATLEAMIKAISPEVAAVSAIAINADKRIVEAGGIITDWNDVFQNMKGRKFDAKIQESLARQKFRDVDYVSAACILLKKEFLDKFGGFDQRFEPFYFEDTDLCKRITANGFKIRLLTDCVYMHLENTSTRPYLKDKFDSIVARSRNRFLEKWENCDGIREISPRQNIERHIRAGIYTPFKINPGGGENYILSILAVIGQSCHACLITPSYVSRYRVVMVAEQLGISLPPFDIMTEEDALHNSFDIMISIGNTIIPEKIFDAKTFYYLCQFPFPLHYTCYHANRQDFGIEKYICYSEYSKCEIEKEISKYRLKPTDIEIVNPPARVSNISDDELLSSKEEVLSFVTVGRFIIHGHRKNQDKILEALLDVSKRRRLKAWIYGALGPGEKDRRFYQDILERNTNPDIIIDANVSNEAIRDAYKCSHFYIHAAGLDTALGIKNSESEHFGISLVEAMSFGCVPIVFGHGGPKEILDGCGVGFQYQSLSELISLLNHVADMKNFREYFAENAKKSIDAAKRYDIDIFNAKIKKLLSQAIEKLKK